MDAFDDRSVFEPVLRRRMIIVLRNRPKLASIQDLVPVSHPILDQVVAPMYEGYLDQLPEKLAQASLLAPSDPMIFRALSPYAGLMKTASVKSTLPLLGLYPIMYLFSKSLEQKKQDGAQLSGVEEFLRKHPVIASSLMLGASETMRKLT